MSQLKYQNYVIRYIRIRYRRILFEILLILIFHFVLTNCPVSLGAFPLDVSAKYFARNENCWRFDWLFRTYENSGLIGFLKLTKILNQLVHWLVHFSWNISPFLSSGNAAFGLIEMDWGPLFKFVMVINFCFILCHYEVNSFVKFCFEKCNV